MKVLGLGDELPPEAAEIVKNVALSERRKNERGYSSDWMTKDDLEQEGYIAALVWLRQRDYDLGDGPEGYPGALLVTVVRRRIIDQVRIQQRVPRSTQKGRRVRAPIQPWKTLSEEQWALVEGLFAPEDLTMKAFEDAYTLEQILATDTQPARNRDATFRWVEGEKLEEIGRDLGVTESRVHQMKTRWLREIRESAGIKPGDWY